MVSRRGADRAGRGGLFLVMEEMDDEEAALGATAPPSHDLATR
jgi:hypothetical protein